MAQIAQQYIVKKAFTSYLPDKSYFEIVEESLGKVKDEQFIVKAEYISVDPYMRSFASDQEIPYKQFGFQVGKVVESKHKDYPVGIYVVSHSGWSNYVILDGRPDEIFRIKPYEPPLGKLSPSLALGALGMPGITAYLGLLEVCKPKQDDIVCVSSAAGAVGSLVGQIARLKGCKVIGISGSDKKVQLLKKELGFHHAFNYKAEDNLQDKIRSVAPNGINCYFDNVGGDISDAVLKCMSHNARVAICGAISTYGSSHSDRPKTPRANVQVNFEAFSFTQWPWTEQLNAIKQMREWIEKGNIKVKETLTNGFDQLPDAFIGMLNGANIGKALVKV